MSLVTITTGLLKSLGSRKEQLSAFHYMATPSLGARVNGRFVPFTGPGACIPKDGDDTEKVDEDSVFLNVKLLRKIKSL